MLHRTDRSPTLLRSLLLACAVSGTVAIAPALAADNCVPERMLDTIGLMRIEAQDLRPHIDAQLQSDLLLAASPAAFGITANAPPTRLTHAVSVTANALDAGTLGTQQLRLQFDKSEGFVIASQQGRHYRIQVREGEGRSNDDQYLYVRPLLVMPTPVQIAADSIVAGAGPEQVLLQKGARLTWSARDANALEFFLARPARLRETAAANTVTELEILRPERLTAEAVARVRIRMPDTDFRSHAPTFCFASISDKTLRNVTTVRNARLIEHSADTAQYDVPLSADAATGLAKGSRWFDYFMGLPIELHVLSLTDRQVTFDRRQELRLTSFGMALVLSMLPMLALYIACGACVRQVNPIKIGAALIQVPSGRLSLANLQVLLWSLLVLFAMFFVWISSGELLPLPLGVMALLGISGGTHVLARTVEKIRSDTALEPDSVKPSASDLLFDENTQRFDLTRFQMLGFTAFSLIYSLVSVLRSQGLPEIPTELYALMGVSNLLYVANKVSQRPGAGTESVITTPADPFETSLGKAQIEQLQGKLRVPISGVLDDRTRAEIQAFKRVHDLQPVNDLLNPLVVRRIMSIP